MGKNRDNPSLTLVSPAKINLGLRVLRRLGNGYHEVEMVMQMIDLHDRMTLTETPSSITVRCSHPHVPCDQTNLAYRAAVLLRESCGVRHGVSITIDKHIPVAAGLGGGSSNAAAALRGLNRLWGLGLEGGSLIALASKLGADVPFFLGGPRALARGRGDVLEPLSATRPIPLVLVHPPHQVSTAWAYGQVKLELTEQQNPIRIIALYLQAGEVALVGPHLINDLEGPVSRYLPVIADIKQRLLALGAVGASMSGSGPTVYGLFTGAREARCALAELGKGEGCDWDFHLGRTVIDGESWLDEVRG